MNSLPEHTFVIDLSQLEERRASMDAHLQERGLSFTRFSALRPAMAEITVDSIRHSDFCDGRHRMAFKTEYARELVGARLSMLACLRLARERRYRGVLILEEDARLNENWKEILTRGISELPAGWIQLYLAGRHIAPGEDVSEHLTKVWNLRSAGAIVYNRAGYDAVIAALEECRSEYDVGYARHLHPLGLSFVLKPQVAFCCSLPGGTWEPEVSPPLKAFFLAAPAMRWSGHRWPLKNIDLPEERPYNAALIPTPHGILCMYRADSSISCAYLNEDGSVISGTHQKMDINNNADPRLVYCGSALFMSTSYYGAGLHRERVELRRLSGSPGAMELTVVGKFEQIDGDPSYVRVREKSWAPFEYQGRLLYVHRVSPQRILEVDLEAGRVALLAATAWDPAEVCSWPRGSEFRLNTPPIRLPDGRFLSTFHVRSGGDFTTWFYCFSGEPPFAPVAVGRTPAIIPSDSKGKTARMPCEGCIFITGLIVRPEEDRVELTGGYNDGYVVVIEFKLTEILADMVRISAQR